MKSVLFYIYSVIAFSLFAMISNPGLAQATSVRLERFSMRLDSAAHLSGGVAVTSKNQILLNHTLGKNLRDDEQKPLIADNPQLRWGSASEFVTAILVMNAIEDGKMDLTTRVDEVFSQFQHAGSLTVEELLLHRSGLPEIFSEETRSNPTSWANQLCDYACLLDHLRPLELDSTSRGEYHAVSTDYLLLGLMLCQREHVSYQVLLEERIVKKMGSAAISEWQVPQAGNAFLHSYEKAKQWVIQPGMHESTQLGWGNVSSTPLDAAHLIYAFFHVLLTTEQSVNYMKENQIGFFGVEDPSLGTAGIGYVITGHDDQFGMQAAYVPSSDKCVVVMSNGAIYPVQELFWKMIDLAHDQDAAFPNFIPIEIKEKQLERYVGMYALSETVIAEVKMKGDGLSFELQQKGSPKMMLSALSENWWESLDHGVMIRFGKNEKGRLDHLALYQGHEVLVFVKQKKTN